MGISDYHNITAAIILLPIAILVVIILVVLVIALVIDACNDRGNTVRLKHYGFWMTGLLSSKSWELRQLFRVILALYLGHGIFHSVAVFVFS